MKKLSKTDLLKRAKKVEKLIKKAKGARRKKLYMAMYNLRWRASQVGKKTKQSRTVISKKAQRITKHKADPNQMFLTGFLESEGVSEIFNQRLSERIDQIVDETVASMLSKVKVKVG